MAWQKIALLAGGAAAAWLAAHRLGAQPKHKPRRRIQRKRGGTDPTATQEQLQRNAERADTTAAAAATRAAAALASSRPPTATSRLLLLLQALFLAAAVLTAGRLRTHALGIQEWQQLAPVAATAAVAGLLALILVAHRRQRALGGRAAAAPDGPAAAAAGAAQEQQQQQQEAAVPLQDLWGVWIKDKAASDSMEAACGVMRLNGVIRTAIRLIKGVELRQGGGHFTMSVLSGILWFKVTERFPLDGAPRQHKRRDLRKGRSTGSVSACPTTGGILLHYQWEEPLGGTGRDHFYLAGADLLHVDTAMEVAGEKVAYRQVYRRKA